MMTTQEVINGATIDRNVVRITNDSLDRPVYEAVKKAMEQIGGKWKGGNIKGFVFQADPTELVDKLKAGEKVNLAQDYQFFGTSDRWADRVVELADLKPGMTVLEPEAGQGAILKAIYRAFPDVTEGPGYRSGISIDCYELMPYNQQVLQKMVDKKCTSFLGEDFLLASEKKQYDRIIANPPFGGNQDIDHIYKMFKCVKRGGRIATFCSKHYLVSSNKKETAFKMWLAENRVTIHEVPPKAFERAGTSIDCIIIVIDKK